MAGRGIYRIVRVPGFVDDDDGGRHLGRPVDRTGQFVADAPWDRVKTGPLDFGVDAGITACDLLLMTGGSAQRLVVALYEGRTAVYYSENGLAGPFYEIRLPGLQKGRIALAHTGTSRRPGSAVRARQRAEALSCRLQRRRTPDRGGSDQPPGRYLRQEGQEGRTGPLRVRDGDRGGSDGLAAWCSSEGPKLRTTGGTPHCSGPRRPRHARRSRLQVLRGQQEKPGADLTYVGAGVHADVHRICLRAVGGTPHGWIACDGGVFRSTNAIGLHSYVPRNDGLAVLEGGYVASHPDQRSVRDPRHAGQRRGPARGRLGVAPHARAHGGRRRRGLPPDRVAVLRRPVHQGHLEANDEIWEGDVLLRRTFTPPVMRDRHEDSEKEEGEASSFYSGIDMQAVGAPSTAARVAIGTNRVWISEDWDPVSITRNTWKTLPSGEDPRARNPRNVRTDVPSSSTIPTARSSRPAGRGTAACSCCTSARCSCSRRRRPARPAAGTAPC